MTPFHGSAGAGQRTEDYSESFQAGDVVVRLLC